MVGDSDFQKAVELINKSTNVLLTTHTKPDGDACGCMVTIEELLKALGKKTQTLFLSEMPQWYKFLFDEKPPILGKDITIDKLKQAGFDLIILIDVNSDSQLPEFTKFLKRTKSPVLVIDHHESNDGLGNVELVDSTAAATGLIVLDLFKYAGWQITEKIATALFVAVATDTGWFRFRNTDRRVFDACAELVNAGANPTALYQKIYLNFTTQRFRLLAAANNSLQLHLDGRYATEQLCQADFAATGAGYEDTENLVDECRRIAGVEVAALFVEMPDGKIRCSLRSSGDIDVCQIAEKFSGGGHKTAAGATLDGPLEKAKQTVLEQLRLQFT
jgi:phosphoesterase RecJ-like protein